jgi:xyloglucan-specific exo-beta-1,4-glucanase
MLSFTMTARVEWLAKSARILCLGILLLGNGACSHEVGSLAQVSDRQSVILLNKDENDRKNPPLRGGMGGFTWRNVNLQGMGYITGMVIHPSAPYDAYIRTDVGGIYRFDRKNHYWIPLTDMFGGGGGVESIAIDPQKSAQVYMIRGSEVFRSSNRGVSWQPTGLEPNKVYTGPNSAYRMSTGERLMVDPNRSGILFFASRRNGLWRYEQSWQQVTGGLPDPRTLPNYSNQKGKLNGGLPGFTFVAFDGHTAKSGSPTPTLYMGIHAVGSANGGVWQSKNGGSSWKNTGGADNPLRGVVASDGTLYVAFGTDKAKTGGVRKFKSGVWTEITPEKGRTYRSITVQPDQPATIMSISDNRVYRSTDGGANWTKQIMQMSPAKNPTAPKYYSDSQGASGSASMVMIDPGYPKQAWWVNGFGVAHSDNVTEPTPFWAWQMQNLEEFASNILRVPPKSGGADLFANGADKMGFRIENRDRVPNSTYNPVGIPINPAFKWAMPQKWKTYPTPFPHVAMGSGLDYAYKKPDYAAFVGWHEWQYWPVYGYTSDNGRTWRAFDSVPERRWDKGKNQYVKRTPMGGQIAMSPTTPENMIWAPAYSFDPHYTKDAGRTWQPCKLADGRPLPGAWANSISPWVTPYILAADRADPNGKTFYYFTGKSFYISKDGGATWNQGAKEGFPAFVVGIDVVVNPTKQGEIWIGFARNHNAVKGNKLYRSVDGGLTFKPVETVDSAEVITFGKGLSPTQPFIYMFGRVGGASQNTMYKSEDLAKTWKPISDPKLQQFPGIIYMEGDMRTPNLVYVSVGGRGIMVGELRKNP